MSSMLSSIGAGGIDLAQVRRFLDPEEVKNFDNALKQIDPKEAERIQAESGKLGSPVKNINFTQPATSGTNPQVGSPPAQAYSQNQGTAGAKQFCEVKPNTVITLSDGRPVTGDTLKAMVNGLGADKSAFDAFMKKEGLTMSPDGKSILVDASRMSGSEFIGAAGASVKSTSGGFSWGGAAIGFMLGGPIGLFMGGAFGDKLKGLLGGGSKATAISNAALGVGGASGGLESAMVGSAGMLSAVGGGQQGAQVASYGKMATMATAAGVLGQDGLEFRMRKQMKNIQADFDDATMMGQIRNPAIPIEDLIFMFLAYMSQKYEDKLRMKMEEAALAEKMERRQEQRTESANQKAGFATAIGSFFGPAGAALGSAVGGGITSMARKQNQLDAAVNGTGKSSMMLNNEIQVLMHKWKQLTELLSNIIKSLHDMAMTPIRNIR